MVFFVSDMFLHIPLSLSKLQSGKFAFNFYRLKQKIFRFKLYIGIKIFQCRFWVVKDPLCSQADPIKATFPTF